MEIAGYLGALIIGITLGLIGGGGSILTVPVFAYLFGIEPVLATAYSLFVVGSTAAVGAIQYFERKLVDVKTAIVFAVPSFIAVFITRSVLVPAIPDPIFVLNNWTLSKPVGIMLFFAVVMFSAAFSMIRNKQSSTKKEQTVAFNYPLILLEGTVVGVLTGLVGAGGGFLIIPALVLFAGLPMKLAVGTSLVIISLKSLIGFVGDIQAGRMIDWSFLLIFTLVAVVGIIIGSRISRKIEGGKIKKAFGWFVLIMSFVIFFQELI
jgi:hypothetical protein